MKVKVVPRPRGVEFLRQAQLALPLVPNPVEDCCSRLMMDCDVPAQDDAREHVTFLWALGLAAETDGNYHSTREFPDVETLAARFRDRVFLADDVLAAVERSDDAVTPAAAFAAVRDAVPRWERSRHTDWEGVWTGRVERILAWAEAFGLVERVERSAGESGDEDDGDAAAAYRT